MVNVGLVEPTLSGQVPDIAPIGQSRNPAKQASASCCSAGGTKLPTLESWPLFESWPGMVEAEIQWAALKRNGGVEARFSDGSAIRLHPSLVS